MKKQQNRKKRARVKTEAKVQIAYGLLVAISFISILSVAAVATVSIQKKNSAPRGKTSQLTCKQQFGNFNERLTCVIEKFKNRKEKDPEPLFLVTALKRLPDGGTCQANDINEKNQIIGYCENSEGRYRSVIWTANGNVQEMKLPQNEEAFGTIGHAINEAGNIAGQSQLLDQQLLH